MYIGQESDSPVEQGYSNRQAFAQVPAHLLITNQPERLPIRVAVAMDFVAMCNRYQHPCGFNASNPTTGEIKPEIIHPNLFGPQEAAMGFACKLLGDFFNGKEVPLDQWQSITGK